VFSADAINDLVKPSERSMASTPLKQSVDNFCKKTNGQIVLVLQGGGALGAYQVGVYQALHEAGVEPDWIIGTSIGAINAGLIAGNRPGDRLARLDAFWKKMERSNTAGWAGGWPGLSELWTSWSILAQGIPGFFSPNPRAFWGTHLLLGESQAAFYSTEALGATLAELIDLEIVNKGSPRLTVGAANVRTSTMHYFDSRMSPISIAQIMASGALPPAFPAVEIDGEYYWDGGILSNTPTEVIFEDVPRRNSLIFAVHLWNPMGPVPRSIWEVLHRQKDIQYSSRIANHIARQQQTHRLRHVVSKLVRQMTPEQRDDPVVRDLAEYGCVTQMHVVRLLAPRIDNENHTKDIDFTPAGIRARRQAGYDATTKALSQAPWQGEFDPIEGVILHEEQPDLAIAAE
jgi:NTE family protein